MKISFLKKSSYFDSKRLGTETYGQLAVFDFATQMQRIATACNALALG